MIDNKRVIALVPMRGGSKTVKGKNIRLLGGKPLLAWPIDVARNTQEIDRVIVSTDDPVIAQLSLKQGAEVYERPKELAGDKILVAEVVRHLRDVLKEEGETANYMILLEATSPFRNSAIIKKCLSRMLEENLDSIATFHEAPLSPERLWSIEEGTPKPYIEGAIPWTPRQLLKPAYQLNGAVYAFNLDKFPSDSPSFLFGKMGAELVSSEDVIDIDTERDFLIANAVLSV